MAAKRWPMTAKPKETNKKTGPSGSKCGQSEERPTSGCVTFEQHAGARRVALVDAAQVFQQGAQQEVVGDGRGELLNGRVMPASHQQLAVTICV